MDARVPTSVLEGSFGVPATIKPPFESSVAATVIWLRSIEEDLPAGSDFNRISPRRIMSVDRDSVPKIPIGTIVYGAERDGDPPRYWKVDGVDGSDPDILRLVVTPATESL